MTDDDPAGPCAGPPPPAARPTFRDLILMLRSDDRDVQDEAVRHLEADYYQALHIVIRGMINSNPGLKTLAESHVFWDSVVMALKDGQVDAGHANPVLLLKTIVKRKILNQIDHLGAQKQGGRATILPILDEGLIAGPDPTASQNASAGELLDRIERAKRELLTEEERALIDLRGEGRSWSEIGKALGATPDAARMKHARAAARLREALDGAP